MHPGFEATGGLAVIRAAAAPLHTKTAAAVRAAPAGAQQSAEIRLCGPGPWLPARLQVLRVSPTDPAAPVGNCGTAVRRGPPLDCGLTRPGTLGQSAPRRRAPSTWLLSRCFYLSVPARQRTQASRRTPGVSSAPPPRECRGPPGRRAKAGLAAGPAREASCAALAHGSAMALSSQQSQFVPALPSDTA